MGSDFNSNLSILFIYVLVTYNNEKDQMKSEHAKRTTTNSYILDAQGQLTMYLGIERDQK